jgi:hypothetical protein
MTSGTATEKTAARRRLRLRILLALAGLSLVLFFISRMERSQVARLGPAAIALHEFLDPPIDEELSAAGKRFQDEIKMMGGRAFATAQANRLERLMGRSERFYVDLSRTSVNDADLARLVKTWGYHIQVLNLRTTDVSDQGLRRLQGLSGLNRLVLGNDEFPMRVRGRPARTSPITDAGLSNVRNLTQLTALELDGLAITDDGLLNLDGLPRLIELRVGRTQIRGNSLDRWPLLRQIQVLVLDQDDLTDAGLRNLAGAPALGMLSLRGVTLSPAQLKLLGRFPGISLLDLYGCPLLDEELSALRATPPKATINRR